MVSKRFEIGFLLDEQWHLMRGEMETKKRPALLALARVLAEAGTSYAIIGGVALQARRAEPRTTLDIDLAVADLGTLPGAALRAAGFKLTGSFVHSENWVGPAGVPVQFTDDPALAPAVERALEAEPNGVPLRLLSAADLLHGKLRAGSEAALRRSSRIQALADAEGLLEEMPDLQAELSDQERAILNMLPD